MRPHNRCAFGQFGVGPPGVRLRHQFSASDIASGLLRSGLFGPGCWCPKCDQFFLRPKLHIRLPKLLGAVATLGWKESNLLTKVYRSTGSIFCYQRPLLDRPDRSNCLREFLIEWATFVTGFFFLEKSLPTLITIPIILVFGFGFGLQLFIHWCHVRSYYPFTT